MGAMLPTEFFPDVRSLSQDLTSQSVIKVLEFSRGPAYIPADVPVSNPAAPDLWGKGV